MPVVRDKFSERVPVQLSCGVGRTKQEFKEECDINRIMARYLRTGSWPAETKVGTYGDFSKASSLQEAYAIVDEAESQFAGLPAKVRDRFKNDAVAFLAWIEAKDFNLEEAHEMGILNEEARKRVEASKKPPTSSSSKDDVK